jgi:hypothetical protein
MKSDTERLLEASIEYVDMKRMLKEVTDELNFVRWENYMLRLRVQRLTAPEVYDARAHQAAYP